jgi:hypothetical protein
VPHDAAAYADLERALDRHATVAGGVVRVTATARSATSPAAGGVPTLEWRVAPETPVDGDAAAIAFDIPYGRRRGASDGMDLAYVQDFDVDAASGLADPRVARLRDGFGVAATYGADPTGVPSVSLDVVVSDHVAPIPEFTTPLIGAETTTALRIQIPEVRAGRLSTSTRIGDAPLVASAAFAGRDVTFRIDPPAAEAPPARPGWRRIEPSTKRPTFEQVEPLLDNALRLADAELARGRDAEASQALRAAALGSRSPRWVRRIRLSAASKSAVWIRRPIVSSLDAVGVVRSAGVEAADDGGFLDARDGAFVGCIRPDSADAVERALAAAERGFADRPLQIRSIAAAHVAPQFAQVAPAAEGGPSTCTDAERVSYIADFDLEVADDAAVADPIIGRLLNGAVVVARPVRSTPGAYDVALHHAVLLRPIPLLQTPIGGEAPVTIQLPQFRTRTASFRIRLAQGASTETTSIVRSAAGVDERRFVFTRE